MAGEPLTIFDPRRNFQTQGFTGRGATTTIHDASATGVSVSGIFQAAEDFAVLGFYNAYDYFNHLRQKHLPRTDLSGLVLEFDIEYDHALDGAMRLDAAKYPSVSWDSMTFVCGKGGDGEIREVKLLSYATVVSGGETPASVSVEASGTQADEGRDHIVVRFRDTQYDCIPWGKLYSLPRSLSSPNGTIDLWPSDLDPVTGELELKVGDTVYFTYDPLYPADPPYQLEEICHVSAIDPVYKNRVTFDNTLPHGGPTVVRSSVPGPFAITAAINDTLTFIIDGTSIYVGLTAGAGADRRSGRRRYQRGIRHGGPGGDRRRYRRRVRSCHLHQASWRGRDQRVRRDWHGHYRASARDVGGRGSAMARSRARHR